MAELNSGSGTNAILESMLQKLRLNTHTISSPQTDIQTCSQSIEFNAETGEHLPVAAGNQFGFSTNIKEQDRNSFIWSKSEKPWTHQSLGGTLPPVAYRPAKRIRRNNSGLSSTPKRPPLQWVEYSHATSERSNEVISLVGDSEMSRHDMNKSNFSLERENKDVSNSGLPHLDNSEPFQKPPDLLTSASTTFTSVVAKPEVRSQSGTWSWDAGKEKSESMRAHGSLDKATRTSKKWGDAKRWAQRVKERWRNRSIEVRQREDGQRQEQNEREQSSLSPALGLMDVNNTSIEQHTTELSEKPIIHNEPFNNDLDEAANSSLSYISENPFSIGTSNLMEEIFSGTEWAQFLSGSIISHSSTTQDQSNESSACLSQSGAEEWNGKWNHTGTMNLHLSTTHVQASLTENVKQVMPFDKHVHNGTEISPICISMSHITDPIKNQFQTPDSSTNQLQTTNLSFNESQKSEETNKHSMPQLVSTQQSDSQPQVFDLNHNQSQGGKEEFIPVLDLSYLKSMNSSPMKPHGSLGRKREHWTKRRDPSEHTDQDMEDEHHCSSLMETFSPKSACNISPTSPHKSLPQDSESLSMETAIKKRRMEDARRVRFAEEVVVLPPSLIPEDSEDWPENPSPRLFSPKWIVSLKAKQTGKYKF